MIGFDDMDKTGITGTTGWKEYMVQVPYNEDEAAKINVDVIFTGKGKIWIDSMRLYVDGIPVDQAPLNTNYPALKDTAFASSSGIDTMILNQQRINYLTLLGELWGFLKYHHPAIAAGNYNWDAELFRILPSVLKCRNDAQLSAVMEKWVDGLGKVPVCTVCKPVSQIKNIAVMPGYASLFSNHVFAGSLIAKLKFILANSNNAENYYVDIAGRTGVNPAFRHEDAYSHINYPDAGYRLLALYRYWNMIQYFSPNRKLITGGWDKTLPLFIPQLIHAGSRITYIKTMVKLISATHDTHAFINIGTYDEYLGNYNMPFQARFIEGKLVVSGFYKDTLAIKRNFNPGDIITAINNIPVQQLVKKYLPFSSASNTAAALRDMPNIYLLRSTAPYIKLNLIRNGHPLVVNQRAAKRSELDFYGHDFYPDEKAPCYRLINKQVGYIFSGRYKSQDTTNIKKLFAGTKGIIVDMRSYPKDNLIADFSDFIKPRPSAFAKLTNTSLKHPGLFVYTEASESGKNNHAPYKGKVVVIVNALTQSAAEFASMAFQSAPNVTVIGTTTAGADGDISDVPLIGFATNITGLGIYYPDGRNAQRAGVKIDYVVKPTIQGIKNGQDELLNKAEKLIMDK